MLVPGETRARAIAPGEVHGWRVEGECAPLLVTVEQQGIDLAVTAGGPGTPAVTVDAPNARWGPETLLLPAAEAAGELRIEIRPGAPAAPPGRYALHLKTLPDPGGGRWDAEAAMSRGGENYAAGTPESLRRALGEYRSAAAAWRELGDRRRQAEAESAAAALAQVLGQLQPAAAGFRRAAALWQEAGEPRREALARRQIGLVLADLGESAAAGEALQQALALASPLPDRGEEAEVRRSLCYLEQVKGDLPAALACYVEVRALFHDLGDRSREEVILNNLGGLFDLQGEPDAALDHYRQALELRRAKGDRGGEAQTLNNIAVIHRRLGEWQEALRLYGEARQIVADLGDRPKEATFLGNLGFAYFSLGETGRAVALWQESLALHQQVGDRRGEARQWSYLGLAARRLGDLPEALARQRRGLALAEAAADRQLEATIRLRVGELLVEQGAPLEALRESETALARLADAGLKSSEAAAFHLRGRALALAGRPAEALPALREALARRRSQRDRAGEAETLHALAAAERAVGDKAAAQGHAEAAVVLVENLRRGFVTPNLRAAFLATERRAYTLLIDLLMAEGKTREALAVSERSRARSLLDVIYQGGAAQPADAAAAGVLAQRRDLRRRLSLLADDKQRRDERGDAERSAVLGRQIELALADLDAVEAEIRRRDPRFAAWSEPAAVTPEAIAALLEPGTLLLEIALGEERSFAWLVGPGVERSAVLPPGREIAALARQARGEMSTVEAGASRAAPGAADLGRLLLAPFWAEVDSSRRLVVVADAALEPVPFAALPVPPAGQGWEAADREALLVAREVVTLPSAAALALVRQRRAGRAPAPRPAWVLADPVFGPDDPRWPAAAAGGTDPALPALPRLPATRQEAEEIARLLPAGEVATAYDFAASRETVLAGQLAAFRVLHFATHGRADLQNPELSGLRLSAVDAAGRPQDGALRLHDLYDLDLAADLAVLSGCETAFGGEVEGEGLMGLTRGFLYAGVPRVVASLWRADDRATAALMTRFYRAMWQEGLSPAAALREAQLALRRDPRYRAPRSWAGFVFQGDWRPE